MDRRSFLRTAGLTSAGVAISSTESFAADALHSPRINLPPPQFQASTSRDRLKIQSDDLTPWAPSTAQPWDAHTIGHLYRRAGFGATLAEIAAAKLKSPSEVVDALLNDSLLSKKPADPRYSKAPASTPWLGVAPYVGTDYTKQQQQQSNYYTANMEIRRHWFVQLVQPEVMLRERLTMFWMNHFVVESKKVYYPQLMYSYLGYIREHAWGNFKKMVSDISIHPAMLIYLDGIYNAGTSPNENYARELQELFAIGVTDKDGKANYSQYDVEAVAAALTGWTIDASQATLPAVYDKTRHNSSLQKIYDGTARQYNLTASGASMDKDLIDQIFDQRGDQIAWYICSKLYQQFVYHDISGSSERAVIQAMATLFKNSNWELKPVLSALLKSAHFFDEANIGCQIKSPFDYLMTMVRGFGIPIPENDPNGAGELTLGSLYVYALSGSQELLDPPNVKGWPGYHNWLSVTTLPNRNVASYALAFNGSLPVLGPTTDGYGNPFKPVTLTNDMVTNWGKQFVNYSGTFDDILKEVATFLCAQPPSATALAYIKAKFPVQTYEWPLLNDALKQVALRVMAASIMQLADYQLS
ncbi:MAG: DUF1800 domain-containing protein [bacterium]